jgi:uncharacterized iron-regulated membrane protein
MRNLTRRLARVHLLLALVISWLLWWVLLSGSLSFYRAELDRWQHPALAMPQGPLPAAELSAQQGLRYLATQAPTATQWYLQLPTERQPYLTVHWQLPASPQTQGSGGRFRSGPFYQQWLSADGQVALAPPQQVKAGDHRHQLGGLFFQLHYSLLQAAGPYSRSVVAYLALLWLLLSLTGLYSLRGRFGQLWRWRLTGLPSAQRQRLRHQQWALVSLPFVLVFAATGWLTQILSENPAPLQQLYPQGSAEFYQQLFPQPTRPADVAPQAHVLRADATELTTQSEQQLYQQLLLDAVPRLMQQATVSWQGKRVGKLNLNQPLQPQMQLTLQSAAQDRIGNMPDSQYFIPRHQAETAVALSWQQLPVTTTSHTLPAAQLRDDGYGLHQSLFWGQTMRLLLFISGLAASWMLWLGVRSWLQRQRAPYWPLWIRCGFLAVPAAMLLLCLLVPLATRWMPALFGHFNLPQLLGLSWLLAFAGCMSFYLRQLRCQATS